MTRARLPRTGTALAVASVAGIAFAALVPLTLEDLHLSGTQIGDVAPGVLQTSANCRGCHGGYDPEDEPYATWAGSLMGLAGRDPLFYAQLTNANQDAANVGYYCLRCHVPMSFVTGHAYDASGATLDDTDRDGVTCHFCHSLVDPQYIAGKSPPEDEAILAGLDDVPQHYGNAMFVLDPTGRRRGPYEDTDASHPTIASSFVRRSEMCGTCHDVGNVAVSRQPDGTFRYNELDQRVPNEDPWSQFPLERTYTEWQLSAFAVAGVDLGGRFGGARGPVVSTCQDCHMPTTKAQGCAFGRERDDLARHEFAGAAAQVLDLVVAHYADDPAVDPALVAAARARSVAMLERAATLELALQGGHLHVRVVNQTGHKLPTGHIEGRRVWIHVRFFDVSDAVVAEHGHYDPLTAHLDEASTTVFEMQVGLSPEAAAATGLPAGPTTHMSLADTIEKDNRIPPRGFDNDAFVAGGAPVVGATYADGQFWADRPFLIPSAAVRAEAELFYQSLTRHYVEALRDGNVTDDWGQILYGLWDTTGRGAPIRMAVRAIALPASDIFGDDFESGAATAWSADQP